MPQPQIRIDIKALETQSDGIIYFDSTGNFIGCSAKMAQFAGSEAALREALEGASWPGDFAAGAEEDSLAQRRLLLPVLQPHKAEVRCVRTANGFVAAVKLEREPPRDFLPEIFSALVEERRAISKHLHSALTQDLVALSLSLSGLRDPLSLSELRGGNDDKLKEAIARVDHCCRGVRALSYVLAPPAFLNAGLIETLRWYGDVLRSDAGIRFELEAARVAADPPAGIKDLFFAAVQHMAAAAIWRPRGASIRVSIFHLDGLLCLRVNCSRGADEPIPESPLIRETAKHFGGRMRFVPGNAESLLEISVPWPHATASQPEKELVA